MSYASDRLAPDKHTARLATKTCPEVGQEVMTTIDQEIRVRWDTRREQEVCSDVGGVDPSWEVREMAHREEGPERRPLSHQLALLLLALEP